MPLAINYDINIALMLAAVLSGGVFGDQSSLVSDSTIISSLASECEVYTHFRTQLPYTLIAFFISLILFYLI